MARTLLVDSWTYHTARVHEANRVEYPPAAVCAVPGASIDVLLFVEHSVRKMGSFDITERERWVTVDGVEPRGTRSLLISASAGKYGEPGDVIDRRDGAVAFALEGDHAATVPTRSLIVIPKPGMAALAFYERSSGRGSSGVDIVKRLHSEWGTLDTGATWKREWVVEAEAWLESAEMKAVEIRRYMGDYLTSGPAAVSLGEYTYGARAGRRHFLPHKDLEQLLKDPKHAHALIGEEVQDGDRVFVELHRDGRQKRFALDGGSLPRVQEEVDPELTDDEFVRECARRAAEIAPRRGISWSPAWVE